MKSITFVDMITTSLLYGSIIKLQDALKIVPQLRKEIPKAQNQSLEQNTSAVQQLCLKKSINGITKQFQVQKNHQLTRIRLHFSYTADLEGNIQFYFGLLLLQKDFGEIISTSQIVLPRSWQIQAINKIFKRYKLDNPCVLMIQSLD